MGAFRNQRELAWRFRPEGDGPHRPRLGIAVLALLCVLGWTTLAGASSAGARPNVQAIAVPPYTVTVQLQPNSIVANGTTSTTATATITDSLSQPVSGDPVTFTAGTQTVPGTETSPGSGIYTATITSTTTAGPVTVTATDTAAAAVGAHGSAVLTQTPGFASNVTVGLNPMSIVADGTSHTTATATVTDANGNPVSSDAVTFTAGSQTVPGSPQGGGVYTARLTSTTTAGPVTVTATDTVTGAHNHATLTQTAGPATQVAVALNPTSIVADGSSFTTATATVTDANGNPVSSDPVTFAAGSQSVPGSPQGGGVYTARLMSTTTVGPVTVTATDTAAAANGAHGSAVLTQTQGPASTVSVRLNPMSIVADGTSHTTATATVTDAQGRPVLNDTITFTSSDPGDTVGATINNHNGTYSAIITSSKTVGSPIITGTDMTTGVLGTATLNQTPGSAGNVAVTLAPPSIVADGTSQTTATATVTDAQGHGVSTDTVVFVSGDPGDTVSATTNNHNGTYTATIISSTTPGPSQVVAVDQTAGIHGQATLTQTAGSSATVLNVVPTQPVTNQTVTIIATVTVALGTPSGTVAFMDGGTPISGCGSVPVAPRIAGSSAATATCQTSFAAASSTTALTAVFTPSAMNLGVSTSPVDSLTVGKDSTSTTMTASSTSPTAGSVVTYLVSIAPTHSGPTQPTGTVQFTDGSAPLSGCASQPVLHGSSSSAAVCRVSFPSPGSHHVITAHYNGDGSFAGSASSFISTAVKPKPALQRLTSQLSYQFLASLGNPTTRVSSLTLTGVPSGASVLVKCSGHGCPYAKRTFTVSNAKSCKPTITQRCTGKTGNTVDLLPAFRHRRLGGGSQVRIEVVRPGFIGKYYLFTMRSRRATITKIKCLAPGSSKPGVGC